MQVVLEGGYFFGDTACAFSRHYSEMVKSLKNESNGL